MTTGRDPRALIRYALVGLALMLILLRALFLVREALLLIYVAALVAIGFGPVVSAIERRRLSGRRRLPRWAAILLVYLTLVGSLVAIGMMIVPPLVRQAREFWSELPALIARAASLKSDPAFAGSFALYSFAFALSPLAL